MAKPGGKDEPGGMDKAELKKHLRLARSEPITVAFAIDESGKAVVQMDKRKPGRALEKMLKDDVPGSKNHRFGTAVVDPDDEKTIRFTINKPGGGMARKLTMALKGTGFSKVKIVLEDGTEIETHQGEEEAEEEDEVKAGPAAAEGGVGAAAGAMAEAGAGAAAKAADAAAGGIDGGVAAAAGAMAAAGAGAAANAAAPPAAPAPAAPAAAPDAGTLAKELTGLVKRMLTVVAKDPTQKAELTELATDAQASLKRGDLAQASAGIDIFREALGDVEPAAGPTVANGPAVPNGAAPPKPAAAATNGAAAANGAAPAHPAATASNGAAPHPAAVSPHPAAPAGAAIGQAASKAAAPNGAQPDLAKEGREILAQLTQMVKQLLPMAESIPGLGGMIKATVAAVQGHVNAGDHEAARGALQGFQQQAQGGFGSTGDELGALAGKAMPAQHHDQHAHKEHAAKHAPNIEKAQKVWEATRQKVQSDVEKLHNSCKSALDGHSMVDQITKGIRTKVDATLHQFDDGLSHTLSSINKAIDAAEREKHVQAAHGLVKRYMQAVSSDPVIKMLDSNPFIPFGVGHMLATSLAAVSKSIR